MNDIEHRKTTRPSRLRKPASAGPSEPVLAKLLEICRYVEIHPTETHSLDSLSRRASLSPFHMHRLFKAFLRITPKKYVEEVRLAGFKQRLRSTHSVTDAIYTAGFQSSSAVYGRLNAHLGMTPLKYRRGGEGVDISFAFGHTPFGKVLIGATDRGICYLQFGDSERELLEQLSAEYPHATVTPSPAASSEQFVAWMTALNENLAGDRSKTVLPLDIQGTVFQKRVWEFLRTIPYGKVVSYGEVASGIGAPTATRAVASACARNRIGVLIPCHRVIRGTGELGGYRWGLSRKQGLIDLERRARTPPTQGSGKARR